MGQVMECLVDRKTDEFFFKVRKFARLNELPPRKTAQYDWPSGFKPREHVLLEEDFLIQEVEVISTKEEVVDVAEVSYDEVSYDWWRERLPRSIRFSCAG